jgi:multicomponent K+:H+ antiporter subunit A
MLDRQPRAIGAWFLENAVSGAAGRNAVNVVIVDFRGFDTLGEILVLSVAALIVAVLLQGFRPATAAPGPDLPGYLTRSLMLEIAGLAVLPLGILVSLFLFLRGHDLPGGGFIGGLVLAASLLVVHLGRGMTPTDAALRSTWTDWIAVGLLAAAATGLGSLALGFPFLTSTKISLDLPLIGKVPLPTATLFDLGVYVAVTAATMLALVALGRVDERARAA